MFSKDKFSGEFAEGWKKAFDSGGFEKVNKHINKMPTFYFIGFY